MGSVGHWFDEKLFRHDRRASCFTTIMHTSLAVQQIAKVDGGISTKEIEVVESLIQRLRLAGVGVKDFAKSVFRTKKKPHSDQYGF